MEGETIAANGGGLTVCVGGRFRHRKRGGIYRVLHLARHSETNETMVVYRRDDGGDSLVWARPFAMFADGRFEPVSD